MLKIAYQIGVEKALKEAGFDKEAAWPQWLRHPIKAWQTARRGRALTRSRAAVAGKGPQAMVPSEMQSALDPALAKSRAHMAGKAPTPLQPPVEGPMSASTAASGTAAAPGAARPVPGWAKMLGLGGVGGGAYYAGARTAPAAATGGFLGLEPDQGLQQFSPELLRLLMSQQGLPY